MPGLTQRGKLGLQRGAAVGQMLHAALAASKSWQRDAARARIQYAEVRHVKPMRNAPAGTVRIDKSLPSREVAVDLALEEKLLPG